MQAQLQIIRVRPRRQLQLMLAEKRLECRSDCFEMQAVTLRAGIERRLLAELGWSPPSSVRPATFEPQQPLKLDQVVRPVPEDRPTSAVLAAGPVCLESTASGSRMFGLYQVCRASSMTARASAACALRIALLDCPVARRSSMKSMCSAPSKTCAE